MNQTAKAVMADEPFWSAVAVRGLWAYRKFYKDPVAGITRDLREIEGLSAA